MILTDADQLREALRLAVQERDDALEWAAGKQVAIVKMKAQRAKLRRQLAVWENASVAQLVRERDEALRERDAVQKAMLGCAVFIGPCAHGRDPWDRCDECGEDNALWAATKAVTARTKERDEARAEVDRLRADLSYAGRERDRWMGQVVAVAERQREADRKAFAAWLREVHATGFPHETPEVLAGAVDAEEVTLPLVTEVDS